MKRYITNERIRGDEFRLINAQGEQVGVVSRTEAFAFAQQQGVDLILIAEHSQPQVVKAINLHKFLYQEEKRNKDSRKGQRKGGTKDVQFSLMTGKGDWERLLQKAHEFLDEGFQVRLRLRIKSGREFGKTDMIIARVKAFISELGDVTVAAEPKMQGKACTAVVVRKK
jgi:translation initiation factor IF-3